MRIVSTADDMQAHPRKIVVNITFAKTIRFIVFPSLNTAKHLRCQPEEIVEGTRLNYRETGYYAILSMTLWRFRGTRWISLQRKQLLGIFVQYLFFRLVR